jgi:mono/diheme cytochrome c family protein
MLFRVLRFGLRFCLALALASTARADVSFNKDIRPILADRCFACHGPDSASREADLRLDQEDAAKALLKDGDGLRAITSGDPKASAIMHRMLTDDPDDVMPPPKSKITVTPEEIELIGKWIKQGAKWEKHWAFLPPQKTTARAGIDPFIADGLKRAGLKASSQANRATLLRRLSFDLTGLPPTLEELDAFEMDKSPGAYEAAVDRLLASPAFGERMAIEWLDVARYGDTDGLFEDHARSIYPWRDWVVSAFNDNLPYSDFITWQVAGDLLPEATVEQKIATGFLRNNTTSNEGGIIQEDYRIKYLVDRVNTTATAFLGLTMECAQCHDHKYDPMTMKEYYQFGGFFNSLVGNGNTKGAAAPTLKVNTVPDMKRLAEIKPEIAKYDALINKDTDELKEAFAAWRGKLATVEWKAVNASSVTSSGAAAVTVADGIVTRGTAPDKPAATGKESTVSGRFVRLYLPKGTSQFLTVSEVEIMSNGRNIALQGTAKQSSDYGGGNRAAKALDGGKGGSFGSCACTKQEDGAWWEVDLGGVNPIDSVQIWNRHDCCPERLDNVTAAILGADRKEVSKKQFGKAVQQNSWVLNEDAAPLIKSTESAVDTVTITATEPIKALRLVAGTSDKSRSSFVISNITAEIQATGKSKAKPRKIAFARALATAAEKKFPGYDAIKGKNKKKNGWSAKAGNGPPHHLTLFPKAPVTLADGEQLVIKVAQTHEGNAPLLPAYTLLVTNSGDADDYQTMADDVYAALHSDKPKPEQEKKALEHYRSIYPGYRDQWAARQKLKAEAEAIDKRAAVSMIAADGKMRKNYVLKRGEYDKPGDEVQTQAPESIMPYADDLPRTRLGLAKWLTDAKNPLTARVAVNRYWQMIFGAGIVTTSEDFGTQGASPSNQELLDTLAVQFVESGWDVKALLKLIVMSATYRQSSVRPNGIDETDPTNALLSYAPRQRLPAEFLRDHALMAGGNLVRTMGGPGVSPYQPSALFGRNAIGNAGFKQSSGDGLYRRSLYTYWKRQVPAANMRILGADGRTVCRTRRESTNTPLQALVVLNDPQFVEAARMIGERMLKAGDKAEERIKLAFRLATSRHITPRELAILQTEYDDRLKAFTADAASADKYLKVGARPVPKDTSAPQLAACSAVASLILNLDESLSKN